LLTSQPVWAGAGHDDEEEAAVVVEAAVAVDDDDDSHGVHVTRLAMPMMSSERGMELFVSKGCVACHAVNGIGGHDSSSLDAHEMDEVMNPFDLMARMWLMAPYMIPAQEEALGEQIQFTGDEMADIVAFLHDDRRQHDFTEDVMTPEVMKMMDHGHGQVSGAEEHEEEIGHGADMEQGHSETEEAGHD
jgi:cytochrome c